MPFKIIPGHHGGIISQMRECFLFSFIHFNWLIQSVNTVIDPAGRFMATASSNRGWSGESTRVVLVHDIKTNG